MAIFSPKIVNSNLDALVFYLNQGDTYLLSVYLPDVQYISGIYMSSLSPLHTNRQDEFRISLRRRESMLNVCQTSEVESGSKAFFDMHRQLIEQWEHVMQTLQTS